MGHERKSRIERTKSKIQLFLAPLSKSKPGKMLSEFWQRYYKAIPALIVIVLLVNWVEGFGWFQHVDAAFLDTFVRTRESAVPPDLYIVEITNDDYRNFFKSTSPLSANVVATLIASVRDSKPGVIGVDLDTQDCAWWKTTKNIKPLAEDNNIVWAQVPTETPGPDPQQDPVLI